MTIRYHDVARFLGVDPEADRRPRPNRAGMMLVHESDAAARLGVDEAEITESQWQYELAGGCRVWYAIDDGDRTVWITKASTRHPNETK